MKRRHPKTPASPIGDQMRKTAIAYKADGQAERAEGYIDCANMVDAWLAKHGLPVAGAPAESVRHEAQVDLEARVANLEADVAMLREQLANVAAAARVGPPAPAASRPAPRPAPEPRPARAPRAAAGGRSRYEIALLQVLAERHPATTTREQLSFLSGKSHRSSQFDATLADLRREDLIVGAGDAMLLTDAGFAATPPAQPLPTGDALLDLWVRRVGPYAGALLEAFVDEHPNALSREDLSEVTGKSATSSQFDASLSLLRKFDLIEGMRATDEFVQTIRGGR